MSRQTQYVGHFRNSLSMQCTIANAYNNRTESLTYEITKQKVRPLQKKPKIKRKTCRQPKPKIVRTRHYMCAYVTVMAVLIIFPVITNLRMLSIGR